MTGQSGRSYIVQEVLQQRETPPRYVYLANLAQTDLPIQVTKRILKDALRGLAVLHDHDIVHTVVEQVQLADLEDSAHVPPDCDIVGKQAGNWMWRSPEAHASGPCIYAVHKRIIFAVSEGELGDGEDILAHVLERQISYFADEEGLSAFYKHLGDDNPWVQVFDILRGGFNKDNPRRPVSLWKDVDLELRDLVGGLTNFDPAKRLTAREALEHPWFKDV
ncbi:kinase-like domain-containing protein [Ustulina deusta]|nr:kinase-like domain-containing protein [Ustulina deusta]